MTTTLTNEEKIMVLEAALRRAEAKRDDALDDASRMYDALLAVRESLERRSPSNGRDDKILEGIYPVIDAHATAYPPKAVTP